MAGWVRFARDERDRRIGRLTLANPGKLGAIDVAMWGALRTLAEGFDAVGAPPLAAIIVAGEEGNFAAGADISEFPSFRFDERTLRAYHEGVIAPALHALLSTEVPLVAQIDGACVGGGLEIACCCDLRIAAPDARFGAPIAKLGFPMAPDELALLLAVAGRDSAAEMLLEARLLDAATALQRGLVHRLADDVAAEAWATAQRIAALPLEVARINKRTLRLLRPTPSTASARRGHFDYAAAGFHREGIRAFVERRAPRFEDLDE